MSDISFLITKLKVRAVSKKLKFFDVSVPQTNVIPLTMIEMMLQLKETVMSLQLDF